MQLKYHRYVNNYIVEIELETIGFSTSEILAMQVLGEPRIVFDAKYTDKEFSVVFDRKINTELKLKVEFNGNDGALVDAIEAANLFTTELQDQIKAKMAVLMQDHKAVAQSFRIGTETITLSY